MKKLFGVVAILLGMMGATYAQTNQIITFQHETHDFGVINEGVVAEHTFTFVNKAAKPVTLGNVQASCGCTTPSWSREPIMPNKEGKIVASYNSEGRPGAFMKTVSVTYNEEGESPQTIVLTLKGTVLGKVKPNEGQINALMSLDKTEYNFGKVQIGQKVAKTFTFKNTGTSDLSITTIYSQCNCITYNTSQQIVKPSETATIELIFAPTQVNNNKEEVVMIYTNSNTQPQVMINLKAEVVQSLAGGSLLKEADGF